MRYSGQKDKGTLDVCRSWEIKLYPAVSCLTSEVCLLQWGKKKSGNQSQDTSLDRWRHSLPRRSLGGCKFSVFKWHVITTA